MGESPFDLDGDDVDQAGESANFKQLRDYTKRLERDVAKLSKDNEGLAAFKAQVETERRETAAAQIFSEVGLSKQHAALYFRLNPEGEVTAESVGQFAQEFGLPVQKGAESTEDQLPASAPTSSVPEPGQIVSIQPEAARSATGFAPAPPAGGVTASILTDADEAAKLAVNNPAEYARLREAGRIKLEKLPGSG